jgi:hypothetical protein
MGWHDMERKGKSWDGKAWNEMERKGNSRHNMASQGMTWHGK